MCYGELGYRLRGKKRLLNIFQELRAYIKLCSGTMVYKIDHGVFLRDIMGQSSFLPVLVIITRVLGKNFLMYNS